ncbi:M48 family metallopeptidase [Thiomicrorhabdus sp. Kp2]|uniref:M48 family metallopeptidase n=1 Tax=Thiomicrorhabdus sp. Kp2 TaxID=1123518 RepID=UPI0003FDD6E4|nr:SprT family zinc-dependent metalloprotease [Thiomicrorhabdus sp. Kp2]
MFALKSLKNSLLPELPTEYQVGDLSLPIVLSARRKSIAIKYRQGQLCLEIPKAIKPSQLSRILQKNQQWLLRRVADLAEMTTPIFSGEQGQPITFFGQNYQCEWQVNTQAETQANTQRIELCEKSQRAKFFLANLKSDKQTAEQCCKATALYYKEKAYHYLDPKLDFYAQKMGVQYHSLTVKGYKSRWGSCYSDGRIQFNWRLMQAPEWVIDYVVVHELAHLVHANHSRDFWNLVEQHYPKTKQAKQVLKQQGREWISFLS